MPPKSNNSQAIKLGRSLYLVLQILTENIKNLQGYLQTCLRSRSDIVQLKHRQHFSPTALNIQRHSHPLWPWIWLFECIPMLCCKHTICVGQFWVKTWFEGRSPWLTCFLLVNGTAWGEDLYWHLLCKLTEESQNTTLLWVDSSL